MNEGLTIYLNMNEEKSDENELLIKRIDDLLLNSGIEYTGVRNLYKPVEEKCRDHAVFTACRTLSDTAWLKGKLAYTFILNQSNVRPMEQIGLAHMTEPSFAKLAYYENYYQKSRTLAHGIIVDEYGQMRDGYTSYIIAKKYGICPDIYEAFAKQPLKKTVKGQHVVRDGDRWKVKCDKIYIWNYTLKSPVVPGDILKVQAKKGYAFIRVRKIDYVTGKEFCKEHRNVIKHMNEHL